MKFLDLFAGIGGFRLGMEMAGHECVGHIEWDKFANASYKAMHNPKEDEFYGEDIRKVRATELPRADVWCFGFPCQDISVAGKQTGFKGHRSSLFFTVTKLIRELEEENRPSILFIENVKNLLSVNGGFDFAKLLIELDEIGYDAEWQVLNSKHFGVPQNRERVFIIGHLRGRIGREVFPIGESSESPSIKIIGTTKPDFRTIGQRDTVYGMDGIMSCLTATDYKQPKQVAIPVLTPDRLEKRQNGRRFKEDEEPMFTLTGQDRHGVMVKEATKLGFTIAIEGDSINFEQPYSLTRRGRVGKGVAQTLTTSCNQATLDGYRIRKLTPKECFRLQGFPDVYFERAKIVNSDSQLYKQAGNSVTVNVIYKIAKSL